ncbi:hypothetical protein LGT41_0010080 [Abyssibius alkaniclasticus]|uniref:hypothetical protein n=1 Tax=Abyssibius alkaniclasticus TaxID=2881234 RepID=UPI0023640EF4|nr:hypothetical protein [Abyssibius alkaniclasticus]UPH70160.1 hypothetical protein LGT41_0010080 [Abyssibius alkaniclasticus]
MTEDSKEDQVRRILEEQLGWQPKRAWPGDKPHFFSLDKANIHDNKSEFIAERDTVKLVSDSLHTLLTRLVSNKPGQPPEQAEMFERLSQVINITAASRIQSEPPYTAIDLALRNVMQTDFFNSTIYVAFEMYQAYSKRYIELMEQETQFWKVSNRPPNYYARTIALRFARFYARTQRRLPTYGTSSDGPYPSTEYGRILEQIYEVLGIDANIRHAAKWAISQLTDEDVNPPPNALEQYIWAENRVEPPSPGILSQIAMQLAVGGKKGSEN